MPPSTVLDIVIGTAYVYFFFSLLAAGVNEWYARLTHRRSEVLRAAITRLLASLPQPKLQEPASQTLAEAFHAHPLHAGLTGVNALDRGVRFVDVHLDDEFELVIGHAESLEKPTCEWFRSSARSWRESVANMKCAATSVQFLVSLVR